jgi:hypothetical protein
MHYHHHRRQLIIKPCEGLLIQRLQEDMGAQLNSSITLPTQVSLSISNVWPTTALFLFLKGGKREVHSNILVI